MASHGLGGNPHKNLPSDPRPTGSTQLLNTPPFVVLSLCRPWQTGKEPFLLAGDLTLLRPPSFSTAACLFSKWAVPGYSHQSGSIFACDRLRDEVLVGTCEKGFLALYTQSPQWDLYMFVTVMARAVAAILASLGKPVRGRRQDQAMAPRQSTPTLIPCYAMISIPCVLCN